MNNTQHNQSNAVDYSQDSYNNLNVGDKVIYIDYANDLIEGTLQRIFFPRAEIITNTGEAATTIIEHVYPNIPTVSAALQQVIDIKKNMQVAVILAEQLVREAVVTHLAAQATQHV